MRITKYAIFAVIALIAIGYLFAAHPAKATAYQGTCKSTGVSVVVAFDSKTMNRCVVGFSGNSWDIIKAAGFAVSGTNDYPTGFVCHINGEPAAEDCKKVPSADQAKWSFFVAAPTDTEWRYSLQGAANHVPECGSAELWTLGSKPTGKPRTFVCH
jgi:hypothetical protein